MRRPRHDDRSHWLALRVALFPDVDSDRHEQSIRRALNDPARHPALVVESDDAAVVGFMECQRSADDDGIARVTALFVAPSHRGSGKGAALLAKMEHALAADGVNQLWLELEASAESFIEAAHGIDFGSAHRFVRYTRNTPRVQAIAREPISDRSHPETALAAADALAVSEFDRARESRTRRRVAINLVLAAIAAVCVLNTNVFSPELVPGVVMPVLDVLFLIYFIGVFLAWRYGRRADSTQRMGELYAADED